MNIQTTNIIVLGGGYSGVMAALRLASRTKRLDTSITLINTLEYFVERPRLHEQATGLVPHHPSIAHMLRGTKARFLQGWVANLDPVRQCVQVQTSSDEQQLAYDYLVLALGSRVNRHLIPGVHEHAFTLDPYGDLTSAALKSKLTGYGQNPFRLVVVGGGATGVEAATQVKGSYPQADVSMVTQGEAGAFKGARVQRHISEALREQAITIHENARVNRVEQVGVVLDSGEIPADIIIWAGGFVASPLAREAGLPVNGQNQVLVDPYLRSLSHPNIYAVGDAADPVEEPGVPTRMSLFTALVSGAQAAENIAAELKGQTPQPLSFVWYGQGIALGPHDAVGFGTYPADVAWPLILRGKLAVKIREFFVWYLRAALELERRFPGSFYWNGKGRYAHQKRRHKQETWQKGTDGTKGIKGVEGESSLSS